MSSIEEVIRSRIREKGRITFAEFMEMALYYPGLGYYTSGQNHVGADGDFYTSPATHPVFAALIALQLEQMWRALDCPASFGLVEMGAGKGLLAQDIIGYLPYLHSTFADALRYVTIERDSLPVQRWPPTGEQVAPVCGLSGCVMSNELLDALPVHLVAIREGKLLEMYVTIKDGLLVEEMGYPSTPQLRERLNREGINLPEGYQTEINLNIEPWMERVSSVLERGFVLAVDYGYLAPELYAPARKYGTLMTYYRHAAGSDPYCRVGAQDITTHVDFSAVISAGEAVGLRAEDLVTQREFLLNLGIDVFLAALTRKNLAYNDYLANRMAMLELIRPEGFGRFKVLVQSKSTGGHGVLAGLSSHNKIKAVLRAQGDHLHVPAQGPEHTTLARGKYPAIGTAEDIW